MCPIFRVEHSEAATPRAKANMFRDLLAPGADARQISADDVREISDLCVNCKMCARECPAEINIPKLMLEAKAAHVAEHGLSRTNWALARIELLSSLGSRLAPLANRLVNRPAARWLLERLLGISRRRRLPHFAASTFLTRARRLGWTTRLTARPAAGSGALLESPSRSGPHRVALFVDTFANYHDPDIAEAAVRVLQHSGVEVHVPLKQWGCGMAPLALGDADTARETLRHNLRTLSELARDGHRIVCPEPTAALMFRHDCLDVLDDPDARLVAERTTELTAFLWELHTAGALRTDFRPLDLALGHHVPCHVKALGGLPAGPNLLALIPRLRVFTIDVGCSGMAGTFGLAVESYAVSLEAGRPMFDELRRPRVLFGSTECSSCRMQMEEGAGKRTLHPVQYLALAYGLMPRLADRLQAGVSP